MKTKTPILIQGGSNTGIGHSSSNSIPASNDKAGDKPMTSMPNTQSQNKLGYGDLI